VIPVLTGGIGTISKSFRRHLKNISGKHALKELQNTIIFFTEHILRKTNIKVQIFYNRK
jgi:hypothetical protein